MPDPTPTQTALEQMHKIEKATADYFAARAVAQNLYFTLQDGLQQGQQFAGYTINPIIDQDVVGELMTILGKAQAFYADLEANHSELLNWKPEA